MTAADARRNSSSAGALKASKCLYATITLISNPLNIPRAKISPSAARRRRLGKLTDCVIIFLLYQCTNSRPMRSQYSSFGEWDSRNHGRTAKTLIIVGECADDF